MSTPTLFAYGTLQDDDICRLVLEAPIPDDRKQAAVALDCIAVAFGRKPCPALVRRVGEAAPWVSSQRIAA